MILPISGVESEKDYRQGGAVKSREEKVYKFIFQWINELKNDNTACWAAPGFTRDCLQLTDPV